MLSVTANGRQIAYRVAGNGDPILLINGTGESGATWDGQMQRLASRWKCVAIDNRDSGDSTYVDGAYTPADMARDAAGVIDALALGPCHVVGYSLGGATAQELALARPDVVRSLVLLSTWARSDAWFAGQMRNWQAIRRAHVDDERAFLTALEPWLFAPATFAERARIEEIWRHAGEIETPQKPEGWIRQCDADIAHDAAARLGDVRAPALVIVGADDICTPPRYSAELCALLPDARLVTIENTAHCAVFEDPGAVAGAIEDFLAHV